MSSLSSFPKFHLILLSLSILLSSLLLLHLLIKFPVLTNAYLSCPYSNSVPMLFSLLPPFFLSALFSSEQCVPFLLPLHPGFFFICTSVGFLAIQFFIPALRFHTRLRDRDLGGPLREAEMGLAYPICGSHIQNQSSFRLLEICCSCQELA